MRGPPRLLSSTIQSQPLAPALSHNGYKDNLQLPCHAHTPLTSYCSLFVKVDLFLLWVLQVPILSRLFLSPFPFHPPSFLSLHPCLFFGLSAGANQLDAGRLPISRALATISYLNQWTCLKPTTRTFSPLAFAVSRLGVRAGARPSHNSAQLFHRRLAQLIMVKTSSATRDQAFPPRFGRPFSSPRDYGLARVACHVPRGSKKPYPRFAARPYRPVQSLSLHDCNRCQPMP